MQPDILVLCDEANIDDKGKYHGIPTLVVEGHCIVYTLSEKDIKFMKVYTLGGLIYSKATLYLVD